MIVISAQIRAAELRRQEFVTQGIAEQWVEQMLGPATPGYLTVPPLALPSQSVTLRRAVRTARTLLTSLATVALSTNRS